MNVFALMPRRWCPTFRLHRGFDRQAGRRLPDARPNGHATTKLTTVMDFVATSDASSAGIALVLRTKQMTTVNCVVLPGSGRGGAKNASRGCLSRGPHQDSGFRVAVFLSAFLLSAFSARTQPAPLDLQLAREPAIVTTTANREFSGLLDGVREERLFIRVATGGGEVGYSFAPVEIEKLVLPGADIEAQASELWDRGAAAEALPLLEALGRQRLRYLPVLIEAHRRPLWLLIRASMRTGNPLATLGYINQLRPIAQNADDRALLRDAELDAHVKLGNADEIHRLASAWCAEADPAGNTALGWSILAQHANDAGDFTQARWTALQPVVFSGHLPMENLDTCYALAISAAHRLNDTAHATELFREMRARQLAWPATPAFAAIGPHYAALATGASAPVATPATPASAGETAVPRSEPDYNRPLSHVRKLIAPEP
jgi:hypothetical protein